MAYGIKLLVWGPMASFNRPEMKVERVSYDVMTPGAARGILEAIYWKPECKFNVKRINVLNEIRFSNVRRNEVAGKIAASPKNEGLQVAENRQQRAGIVLINVKYGIEAEIEVVKNDDGNPHPGAKHVEMFKNRASKGKYFHHPYLGNREFPALFKLVEEFPAPDASLLGERDLGYMLNDFLFTPADKKDPESFLESNTGKRIRATPVFFRAKMIDGVIDVPPVESGETVS